MGHLTVMTSDQRGRPRVVVRGQLDLSTSERLEQAVSDAELRAPDGLTIDVSGLEFIDSTGLQVLIDADLRARGAGRGLSVVLGRGEARRVAELADVASRLDVPEAG